MAASPLSVPRFRNIFIISWLIVIADHIFLLRWFGHSWEKAIADSLVNDLLLFGACLLMINSMRFYLPQWEKSFQLLFKCIVFTVLVLVFTRIILNALFHHNEEYKHFFDQSLIIRASLDFLLLGVITLISVIWFNWQEQQEQEKIKQDAEKLAREAELFKLRQQLQPHFLFNSLNSINALIGAKPDEARKMVQQLSDFLRGTIRKEEHQLVSLKEELKHLGLYLSIEKVRFGNRLSAVIECEKETEESKLPVLLLQPIMENAIKFGLYDTTEEIFIRLHASKDDGNLLVKVTNPFDPETYMGTQGTGFGLQSVQRRLYLLYARNDLLTTETKDNIFITTVKIPQTKTAG
jgi:LytS/YehU family sensor histidine kinase